MSTETPPLVVFSQCSECGESFTGMPESGICVECGQKAKRKAEAERFKGLTRYQHLIRAGAPERIARTEFTDQIKSDRAGRSLALRWDGEPWSLFIFGPNGTGKTMLACEVLHLALRQRFGGRFVRASRVPGYYFSGEQEDIRKMHRLYTAGCLVVDELGRGHPGGGWAALGELIGNRYDSERMTIVTSNDDLETVAEHDPHLADRLNDGLLVHLGGESLRGR